MTSTPRRHPRQGEASRSFLSLNSQAKWSCGSSKGTTASTGRVEAASEDEAVDRAADQFADRESDEDDDEGAGDLRAYLTVVGVFRGDVFVYSDELEFVPFRDIDENTAYGLLQYT